MPDPSNRKKSAEKATESKPAVAATPATTISPSTPLTSILQLPTLSLTAATKPEPPLTYDTISLACFISQANLADIKCFLKAARSGQEAFNLKTLLVHAFLEGKKVKQAEEYKEGYKAGY
jgi:hypothetical protein